MDKLRAMETFIAVVEGGNFTEASQRLEISAVMVGKYVRELEERLGARLLERTTRGQSLTDAGRVFYEDAKRALEHVRMAETSIERLRASPSGTLRISAPVTFFQRPARRLFWATAWVNLNRNDDQRQAQWIQGPSHAGFALVQMARIDQSLSFWTIVLEG
jgi:DNA-binding transcriptional LysR family regulator